MILFALIIVLKNDEKYFLFHLFGHAEKSLDQKGKANFEIHDVTAWLTNNCYTHIAHYLIN